MSTLSITARRFKELVAPVLSSAGTDSMLPVLNTVRIETRGQWLVAIATDRFRVAVNRTQRPEGSPDDWAATIPLKAIKGIVATFAPRKGMDADLSLTIDGGNLAVSAEGAMVGGFFDASFRWALEDGEFPGVMSLISKALAAETTRQSTKVRMNFLAAFGGADVHGQGLWVKTAGTEPNTDRNPVVVTDGENFIGLVMPHRGAAEFPALTDWADVFDPAAATEPEAVAS